MKIWIDNIIFSLQKTGGISVVWYEIIKRLLCSGVKVTFIEYSCVNNMQRMQLVVSPDSIIKYPSFMLRYKRYLPVTCKNVNESFIFHSSYFSSSCILSSSILRIFSLIHTARIENVILNI